VPAMSHEQGWHEWAQTFTI